MIGEFFNFVVMYCLLLSSAQSVCGRHRRSIGAEEPGMEWDTLRTCSPRTYQAK